MCSKLARYNPEGSSWAVLTENVNMTGMSGVEKSRKSVFGSKAGAHGLDADRDRR